MRVLDIFSKRRKRDAGDIPDVYTYDRLPSALRTQICHIWRDALPREWFGRVREALCREYGLFHLSDPLHQDRWGNVDVIADLTQFILTVQDVERALDAVEVSFAAIDLEVRKEWSWESLSGNNLYADDAIEELNRRFAEHAIGYRYEGGKVLKIDSEFVHQEVVRPALRVLHDDRYAGANEEFLKAHEHYRRERYEESINESLKAFESTMKVICEERRWDYPAGATASKLIETCLRHGLIPKALQSQLGALRSLLESGVPTVRNREGGHGQGREPRNVPPYYAALLLHLTASIAVFLTEADNDTR